MTFRSSSSTSFAGTTALTATAPAGVTAGDRLLAMVTQDSAGQSHVAATGWAPLSTGANLAAPDGQTVSLFEKKTATGSDAYNFTTGGTQAAIVQVMAFSGRDNAAAAVLAATTNTTANATPISVSMTGVTASNGDDVAYFLQLDQVGQTDNWNLTAPSGYTERQDVANLDFITAACGSQDGVGAGATGSLAITATRTAGSSGSGYSGYVVTLSSGTPSGPAISKHPVSQTVLEGAVASFTVSATGTGTLHYQWQKNGANVGTDSATLSLQSWIADGGAQITVTVTDGVGPTTSGVAYLYVLLQQPVGPKRRRRLSLLADFSPAAQFGYQATPAGMFDSSMVLPPGGGGGGGVTAVAADSINVTDAADAITVRIAAASDALTVGDSATSFTTRISVAADTFSPSDSATGATQAVAAASDGATFSDSAIALNAYVAAASDSIALTDSAAAITNIAAAASDTLTVADSAEATTSRVAVAADTLTFSDSTDAITSRVAVATDSIAVSDSAVATSTLAATATDSATFSDSATASQSGALSAAAADSITLIDAADAATTRVAAAVDSATFSDFATAGSSLPAFATDGLTLTDSAVSTSQYQASAVDASAFSDSATASATLTAAAADSVTLSDSAASTSTRPATAADTLSFSDSADGSIATASATAEASDTIVFSDSAQAHRLAAPALSQGGSGRIRQDREATDSESVRLQNQWIANVVAALVECEILD